jgi:hypothetical protein
MAFNSMNANFGGGSRPYAGQPSPNRLAGNSNGQPVQNPFKTDTSSSDSFLPKALQWTVGAGSAIGTSSATSRSMGQQSNQGLFGLWGVKSLDLTQQNVAAHTGNLAGRFVEAKVKNSKTSEGIHKVAQETPPSDQASSINAAKTSNENLSYGKLLALNDQAVDWKNLSWKNYRNTVQENFKDLNNGLKAGSRDFFTNRNISLGRYLKETVVGENVRPVKSLFSNNGNAQWGSGLMRSAGFGLMSLNIAKKTHQSYQNAKAQEDGSFGSKIHTATQTTKTFIGESVKNIAAWEAGGFGFAIGKALLPFSATIPGLKLVLPLGGILMGGLGGALAYKTVDKIAPAPQKPESTPS